MPTFSIPGGSGPIHVVDIREETPVPSGALPMVFVHGMVGHTGFWNAALASCADVRRAVAIDLRGHGNSSAPSDRDYSVEACASDVLAVLDALQLTSVVLVGHSYGTFVTIEVAARRPERVRRLVLVDPPGDFTRLSSEERETQLTPYIAAIESDGWRKAVEADFDDALAGSGPATGPAVRARLATMPRDALLSMFRSMMNYPAAERLDRYLASPGTAVHDILAPANQWPISLHNLMPALRTTVVPNVGHWIMLDAPDRFVSALSEAAAGI